MGEMIIGLAGKARSGKDTAANFLELTYGLEQMSFAAPIRQAVADMFALTPNQINGDQKESPIPLIGKSPRQLFQTLGTEWGRNLVHPDVWVKVAGLTMNRFRDVYSKQGAVLSGFVFSDIRFENEARFIREQDGLLIHLHRPGAPSVSEHVSESGIKSHPDDCHVNNDGTLLEMYNRVQRIVAEHYG